MFKQGPNPIINSEELEELDQHVDAFFLNFLEIYVVLYNRSLHQCITNLKDA